MAEVAITAANVREGTGAIVGQGTAGEALEASDQLYLKAADSKIYKASCDLTAAEADVIGTALHPTNANQRIAYQKISSKAYTITIGGTLVVDTIYVLGTTPGKIMPIADLVATNKIVILGIASSVTVLDQSLFKNTGRAKA